MEKRESQQRGDRNCCILIGLVKNENGLKQIHIGSKSKSTSLVTVKLICQSEGGNGLMESPGRDRDMDLCWERAVVQTCWPSKINHAGLMSIPLGERKSGLEVWRTRLQISFSMEL